MNCCSTLRPTASVLRSRASQPVIPEETTTARIVSRDEPSIKRVDIFIEGNTLKTEGVLEVMKKGFQYDASRQLAIIQLPARRIAQRVKASMLLPSSDGQLIREEVASQWSSGYQENMN